MTGGEPSELRTFVEDIVLARRPDAAGRAAVGRLVGKYHAYIVRQLRGAPFRFDAGRAEEWACDFEHERFLESRLLEGFEPGPGKGRFRGYLFRALHNWAVDRLRKEATERRRLPAGPAAEDVPATGTPDLLGEEEAAAASAAALLAEAVIDLYKGHRPSEPHHWNVFRARHLLAEPWGEARCVAEFGLGGIARVSSISRTMRLRLRDAIRARVTDLEGGERVDEAAEEVIAAAHAYGGSYLPDLPFIDVGGAPDGSVLMAAAAHLPAEMRCLTGAIDLGSLLREALTLPGAAALGDASASAEALGAAKDAAKGWEAEKPPAFPSEVCRWVYYATLAAALPTRISRQDEAALRKGIAWALRQPWRERALDATLQRGLGALGG